MHGNRLENQGNGSGHYRGFDFLAPRDHERPCDPVSCPDIASAIDQRRREGRAWGALDAVVIPPDCARDLLPATMFVVSTEATAG